MDDDGVTGFTVEVPAPRDEVWRWLREPARIQQWFGWQYEGLAEEIAMIFSGANLVDGAPDLLHFGGHQIRVVDAGASTRLEVSPCAPTPDEAAVMDWAAMADDIEEGWRTFLEQLRFAVTAHPEDARTTRYLAGTAVDPDPAPIWSVLGLAEPVVGQRWSGALGPEPSAAGTVWAVSPLQVLVTVDGWGPGLLAATQAPNRDPEWSGAALTLSTYGLGGEQLDQLTGRWNAWWGARYAPGGSGPQEQAEV